MTDLIYISTIMLVFTSVFKFLLKETARTWLFLRGCLLYNQYLPCQKIGLPMVFGCCLDENQKVGSPRSSWARSCCSSGNVGENEGGENLRQRIGRALYLWPLVGPSLFLYFFLAKSFSLAVQRNRASVPWPSLISQVHRWKTLATFLLSLSILFYNPWFISKSCLLPHEPRNRSSQMFEY